MGSLANSEDPDEMQHDAAFHLGLHCLLKQNQSFENIFFIDICAAIMSLGISISISSSISLSVS